MSIDGYVILVIGSSGTPAENLKELIEFLDTPRVRIAMPDNWLAELGEERLEAVFIGPDLSADDIRMVVDGVRTVNANVPIVVTQAAVAA